QLLVVSGSCSPVTAGQLAWAVKNGFAAIGIDTASIAETGYTPEAIAGYITLAISFIRKGQSVIIHTSSGMDDRRVKSSNEKTGRAKNDVCIPPGTAELFGTTLGLIAKGVAQQTGLKRLVIAGGDTSSYAARAMGIEAVEMIAPLSPGA